MKYNPLNHDKTIDTKHILHIYYLTDVDYTEQEIALNSRGKLDFFVSIKMALLWTGYIF